MSEPTKLLSEYLGDGVYAIQEPYGFWLRTNHHHVDFAGNEIFIEPEVFVALIEFALSIGYIIKT